MREGSKIEKGQRERKGEREREREKKIEREEGERARLPCGFCDEQACWERRGISAGTVCPKP